MVAQAKEIIIEKIYLRQFNRLIRIVLLIVKCTHRSLIIFNLNIRRDIGQFNQVLIFIIILKELNKIVNVIKLE